MDRLTFRVTRVISAPNDRLWQVIGDFGTEHRWTKTLSRCERSTHDVRVGTVRTCVLPRPLMGHSHVEETLVEFERGASLRYELRGDAGPFAAAASRWSTAPTTADSTAVTVDGFFRPKNQAVRMLFWPLAKPYLRRLTGNVLGELERYVLSSPTF